MSNTFKNIPDDSGGGGSVTDVTASGVLSSSGGATPDITFTGILPIANGGTGQATFPIILFTSTPVGAGAADAVVTVTGLLSTDTILSVSQKTRGATTAAFIGWDTQINNSITGHWSADPGGLATLLVLVKR